MKKVLLIAVAATVVAIVVWAVLKDKKSQLLPENINTADNYSTQTNETNNTTTSVPAASPTSTTSTDNNINKPMDLSQYKTPITLIDQNKTYAAKMKTTAGDIEISLNAKATPITVNNFVFLSKKNFYDNVIFHRVIKGFMIQGGDPTGTGAGGPGYRFDDESFTGEYLRGTIAMANAGPNTNGSQFFIMHDDYPLPPQYVIFGKVTKGLETVDKIAEAPTTLGADGQMSKPVNPVKILSVEIIEK